MFSKNVVTFLSHLLDEGELKLDLEVEITKGSLLTHDGQVTQAAVRDRLGIPAPDTGAD